MDILLIEDNDDDILLTTEAVEEIVNAGFDLTLRVVYNGIEALSYLQDGGSPDLILLDLNMPKMGGLQFLRIVKDSTSPWKRIPICVLTTSKNDRDIIGAYDSYCSCYLEKPILFDSFVAVLKQLGSFWFRTVTLPPR